MAKEIVKCEVCGKECKNLGVHMRKHKNEEIGTPPKGTGDFPEIGKSNVGADDPLVDKMDSVIKGLNSVASAVNKLIEMQTAIPSTVIAQKEKVFNPKLEDETYPSDYIPPRFRKIVDEILSTDFGLRVVDFPDRTDMQIDIIVPDKFSSVSEQDKEKGIKDIRSRIMTRSLGENGVKEWCMLVRKNLNRYYQREGVQSPFIAQS